MSPAEQVAADLQRVERVAFERGARVMRELAEELFMRWWCKTAGNEPERFQLELRRAKVGNLWLREVARDV